MQTTIGYDYNNEWGTMGDTTPYYRIDPRNPSNRIPITEKEYNRLKKEYEGDGKVVEIDWKPLAEYGK